MVLCTVLSHIINIFQTRNLMEMGCVYSGLPWLRLGIVNVCQQDIRKWWLEICGNQRL